jgi:hypothetical protein
MYRLRSGFLAIFVLLSTACRVSERKEGGTDDRSIRAAQSGLRVAISLTEMTRSDRRLEGVAWGATRSSALLGEEGQGSARGELDRVLSPPGGAELSDAELLQKLIALLTIDIQEHLNRVGDRAAALRSYEAALSRLFLQGQERLQKIQGGVQTAEEEERELTRRIREFEKALDEAMRGEGEQSAKNLIEDLLESRRNLARTEGDLRTFQSLQEVYSDVLGPLERRLHAIDVNRDALVKGVRVIDVSGIEDLGILGGEEGDRPSFQRRGPQRFGGAME